MSEITSKTATPITTLEIVDTLYTHLPEGFDLFGGEPLSQEIWASKYRFGEEASYQETAARVVNGVYEHDFDSRARNEAYTAMAMGLWMPGGRITAGAGTGKRVTLFNCYVNSTLEDSMEGIGDI